MIISWLVFMALIAFVAHTLDRNPWVFGAIGLVFSPVTSAIALFVWHNWLDKRG